MDLLKDKGVAPRADVNSNEMVSILNGLVDSLSQKMELPAEDYDFMDLMHDKGLVPKPDNDNDLGARAA